MRTLTWDAGAKSNPAKRDRRLNVGYEVDLRLSLSRRPKIQNVRFYLQNRAIVGVSGYTTLHGPDVVFPRHLPCPSKQLEFEESCEDLR